MINPESVHEMVRAIEVRERQKMEARAIRNGTLRLGKEGARQNWESENFLTALRGSERSSDESQARSHKKKQLA